MDWISTTIVILALASSVIAWIAKLRWSSEYKEAKEAQINFLKEQLNHYKDLSSNELIEYFKSTKEELEHNQKELRLKLERERKLKSNDKKDNEDEELRTVSNEKKILLNEIRHRVKNNLAIISGLIQLESYSSNDDDLFKEKMQHVLSRIKSISLVHELVYESDSFTTINFKDLVENLGGLQNQNIYASNQIDLSFNINRMMPLSLIINEIFTWFNSRGVNDIHLSTEQNGNNINILIRPSGKEIGKEVFEDDESISKDIIGVLSSQMDAKVVLSNPTVIRFNQNTN